MKWALILVLLITSLSGFRKEDETLPWSSGRPLTWNDFKARPDEYSGNAALTSSGIEFKYSYGSDGLSFSINCLFEKNKSWGKERTQYILSHEQGHFDISELHARKLNRAMKEYRYNEATASKDIPAIYNHLMKEQTAMQNQYDNETNFSRNKEMQEIWLEMIDRQLEQYQDFAHYSSHSTSH